MMVRIKSSATEAEVEQLVREIESRLLELPMQGTEAVGAVRRAISKRLRSAPGPLVLTVALSPLRRPPTMLRFARLRASKRPPRRATWKSSAAGWRRPHAHHLPFAGERPRRSGGKALAWALRELVKHSPSEVREFLASNDTILAACNER
jgi:hypothetical protein